MSTEWLAPTSLQEALELRARYADDATVVLVRQSRLRKNAPRHSVVGRFEDAGAPIVALIGAEGEQAVAAG